MNQIWKIIIYLISVVYIILYHQYYIYYECSLYIIRVAQYRAIYALYSVRSHQALYFFADLAQKLRPVIHTRKPGFCRPPITLSRVCQTVFWPAYVWGLRKWQYPGCVNEPMTHIAFTFRRDESMFYISSYMKHAETNDK